MNTERRRGFASLSPERRREVAAKGGANVPAYRRSYAVDRALAAEAGRKGGQNVPAEKRSFSRDRKFARECGRKGGKTSRRGEVQPQ